MTAPAGAGLLGSVLAGVSAAGLWAAWACFFACLEAGQAERVILRSMVGTVVVATALLALPATPRFLLAQVIPLISAWCAVRARRWVCQQNMSGEQSIVVTEKDAADTTVAGRSFMGIATALFKQFDGFDREEFSPLAHLLKIAFGLGLPAALVFFITPPIVRLAQSLSAFEQAGSVTAAFALAALLTAVFLRMTPSVTLSFIFRWQVPVVATAVLAFALGAPVSIAYVLVSAALIVMSEFIWICLCRAMRADRAHALRVFLVGYLLFDIGIFLGSFAAYAVLPMLSSNQIAVLRMDVVVLFAISAAATVMIPRFVRGEAVSVGSANALASGADKSNTLSQVADLSTEPEEAHEPIDGSSLSDEVTQDNDENFYREYNITPREQEIIAYLLKGRSVPYIRDELFISQNTVKTHIKHIYAKTDVSNRQELIDLIESMRD